MLVAVGAVVLLLIAGRRLGALIPAFSTWVDGLGVWGAVAFVAGYALATVAFVPGSLLTLAAGAIFGLGKGTALVLIAATLGASAAFLVSRYVARGFVERRLAGNERFAAIDRAIGTEGRKIVLLLRLSPIFPFNLLNYALGLTRVRFADYLVASVGMLPGTLLYVYYGKVAGDVARLAGGAAVPRGPGYYVVVALGLVATLAVTTLVARTARRALQEVTDGDSWRRLTRTCAEWRPNWTGTFASSRSTSSIRSSSPMCTRPAGSIPEPRERYHLVVIGAGTGGLVTASIAAGLGARVALVERYLMGGDCLNVGCVPSKGIISAARSWQTATESRRRFGGPTVTGPGDFGEVMARMRRLRAGLSRIDGAPRYRDLGVDVFLGEGRFTGHDALMVGGRTLRFRRAVIATGARPAVPPVPGLETTGYLTNETIFGLTELPRRLTVIGAGPIGCELAQAFARLGSAVTVIDAGRAHPAARGRRRGPDRRSAPWKRTACGCCSPPPLVRAETRDGERVSPRPGRRTYPRRSPATSCSWPPGACRMSRTSASRRRAWRTPATALA